jgi:1-deoxy-D-xylulose-5-phosphate synthase
MHTAHAYENGPFSIRYPKGSCLAWDKNLNAKKLKIGSWERLRTGEDLVVLAAGSIIYSVEEALTSLEKEGFRMGLVNARFIKPFDQEMLGDLISEYEHIVTVEENSVVGGFGSVIENYIHEELDAANRVTRIGIPDKFFEHGGRDQILHDAGLSAERLAERLRELSKSRHQISAVVS